MSDSSFSKKIGTPGNVPNALGIVCAGFPYLSGLVAVVDVRLDDRIETAAATASGKILIGTDFYEKLSLRDLAVILAHELLHIFRQTHSRSETHRNPRLVNIADDFIVNDIIRENMGASYYSHTGTVLDVGLNWHDFLEATLRSLPDKTVLNFIRSLRNKNAMEYSLEEMVVLLGKLERRQLPKKIWPGGGLGSLPTDQDNTTSLGAALADAGLIPTDMRPVPGKFEGRNAFDTDILSKDKERQLFPDEDPASLDHRVVEIQEVVKEAAAESVLTKHLNRFSGRSGAYRHTSSYDTDLCDMLKGIYRTPWEAALQRWFDTVSPGDRCWARPSRRGAFRTDIVLPGRNREGWILHLVFDTSGSMYHTLPAALGAIASFCEANHVDSIHVVQCDTDIRKDEYIAPDALQTAFEICGYGGTAFDTAFDRLAAAPEVKSVVVLTDGGVIAPPEPPFEVLWAILGSYRPSFPYGTIVNIDC